MLKNNYYLALSGLTNPQNLQSQPAYLRACVRNSGSRLTDATHIILRHTLQGKQQEYQINKTTATQITTTTNILMGTCHSK